MSRYVDADATLETLKEFLIKTAINNVGYKRDVDEVCKDIADNRLSVWLEYVPTADVVEVVHGEWVKTHDEYWDAYWHECSNCGKRPLSDVVRAPQLSKFCPHCGADMRGEKNVQKSD